MHRQLDHTDHVGMTTTTVPRSANPSVDDLAFAAKPTRNRAIDFYRALAMLAVAFGHWLAISLYVDGEGSLQAGNALDLAPQFAPISWILQVMPLFFVVGGFASSASLDAHARDHEASAADWVSARLRRLFAPVTVLASFWLSVIAVAGLFGYGSLAILAATAAAVPLWFIANYAIDTAIAPITLPAFRRSPKLFAVTLLGTIGLLEALRFSDNGFFSTTLPHFNWILGWLGFQVAGFAWRDGFIRSGRSLALAGAGALTLATLLVTVGPYPVSMVHFNGIGALSPTHPPSLALLLFGTGYSALAVAAAPAVNRMIGRQPKLWKLTVAANSVAMSVYLWHFTAAAVAGAGFYALGILPTAPTGTAAWWIQKVPLIAVSTVVLAGIVALVARFEQRALLATRVATTHSYSFLLGSAAALSLAVKGAWTSQTSVGVVVGSASVAGIYTLILRYPNLTPAQSASKSVLALRRRGGQGSLQ